MAASLGFVLLATHQNRHFRNSSGGIQNDCSQAWLEMPICFPLRTAAFSRTFSDESGDEGVYNHRPPEPRASKARVDGRRHASIYVLTDSDIQRVALVQN